MMDSADDEEFDTVRHFDAEKAQAYDEYIPRVIPGYENLHQLSASIVQTQTGGRGLILVVGAGTGEDSINVCRDNPLLSVVGSPGKEAPNSS
ncbi:MAG: hypothetical protein O3B76_04960 [Proteobacteria bacterium]|nr:hypothetical protein [Pseudomonadota bacterium]MDA1022021.1 hypothetical protein [Pseudomonadota bacterium]